MHIVLVYRYYNDGIVYYNLTFCTRKSLMTDLGLTQEEKVYMISLHRSLLISIIKNDYYQYENEVRIVGIGNKMGFEQEDKTEFFRVRNGEPIPYVKEYFSKDFLKSVWLGPSTQNKVLSKETIQSFLKSRGFDVDVVCSPIPFRS